MRKILSLAVSIVFTSLISACGSSPSPILPPAKLKPITEKFVFNEVWFRQIGEGVSDRYYLLKPLIYKDALYTIDYEGHLSVTEPLTGDIVWSKELNLPVSAGLTRVDDMLLLATSEGDVVALDINTAKQIWKSKVTSEVFAKPVRAGKYIIVKSVDGKISALEFATGKVKWVYDRAVPALTLRGNSGMVVHDNTIITGLDNGKLIGLSVESGQIIWTLTVAVPHGRTEIERMIDIDADPVLYNDNLFVVAYQGRIANIHIPTGQIVWTRDFSAYSGLAVDDFRVYITDSEGYVWALDRKSGATVWKQDKLVRRSLTQPVLHNKSVIVADFNGFVHWLDYEDGHLKARFRQGGYDSHTETEDDFVFPKSNSILIPPVTYKDRFLIFDRHGHISSLSKRQ